MQEELMQEVVEVETAGEKGSRRAFLGRVAAMGIGAAVLGATSATQIAQAMPAPTAKPSFVAA